MTLTQNTNTPDATVMGGGFPNIDETVQKLRATSARLAQTMGEVMLERTLIIGDYLVHAGITTATTRGRGKVLDALTDALGDGGAGLSRANVQRFARYYLEARDRGLTLTAGSVKALNAAIEAGSEAYTATITSPGLTDDNIEDRALAAIDAAKAKKSAANDTPETVEHYAAAVARAIERNGWNVSEVVAAIRAASKTSK